jgi:hypothetical protein
LAYLEAFGQFQGFLKVSDCLLFTTDFPVSNLSVVVKISLILVELDRLCAALKSVFLGTPLVPQVPG